MERNLANQAKCEPGRTLSHKIGTIFKSSKKKNKQKKGESFAPKRAKRIITEGKIESRRPEMIASMHNRYTGQSMAKTEKSKKDKNLSQQYRLAPTHVVSIIYATSPKSL